MFCITFAQKIKNMKKILNVIGALFLLGLIVIGIAYVSEPYHASIFLKFT